MNNDPMNQASTPEMNGAQSKICPRCGKELPADAQFCGECGFRFSAEGQSVPYTVPAQPMMMADMTPLKTTDYLLMFLISGIPVVGLVLLFVWAFSSVENVNRRNYCRAHLIWLAISTVIGILFFILYAIAFASIFEYVGTSDYAYEYFYGMIFR